MNLQYKYSCNDCPWVGDQIQVVEDKPRHFVAACPRCGRSDIQGRLSVPPSTKDDSLLVKILQLNEYDQ